MCGICGIINFSLEPVEPTYIQKMMDILKHRGPDDEDNFIDRNIGLGHVRLSIIDLTAAGRQPMFSSDKRHCILHNGEVYNYLELKEELQPKYIFKTKTDTEVILNAFIEWGVDCLKKFNGMFAFVIYDTKTRQLFIARDRFGIKPLYYYKSDKKLIFASETSAILPFIKDRKVNNKSIFEYLVYNRTDQSDETFFSEIKKLPKGSYLKITNNNMQITKWYNLQEELKPPFEHPKDLYEVLKNSIKLRLRSDVPVGVCLSGGIDSSSIVSILLKDFNKNDINTFSAVYQKGEKADESDYIAEYNRYLRNMYFTHPTSATLMEDLQEFVECHSEPVATLGPYAQFKVMQLAKKKVVVTLDGQGADEELAGYHYFFGGYFKQFLISFRLFRFLSETFSYMKKYNSLLAIKYLLLYLAPSFLKDQMSKISHNFVADEFYQKGKKDSDVKSSLYNPKTLNESLLQHFEFKLEHLLKWEDHNSMWYSLESRVPFLDHQLVERTLSLPVDKIIKNATTKFFLRQAMKGVLPENIRNRKDKIGFATPWEKWFRAKKLRDLIFDVLSSNDFRDRGYLNPERCLKAYNFHLENKTDISKEIWKWVNLELWFKKFID